MCLYVFINKGLASSPRWFLRNHLSTTMFWLEGLTGSSVFIMSYQSVSYEFFHILLRNYFRGSCSFWLYWKNENILGLVGNLPISDIISSCLVCISSWGSKLPFNLKKTLLIFGLVSGIYGEPSPVSSGCFAVISSQSWFKLPQRDRLLIPLIPKCQSVSSLF